MAIILNIGNYTANTLSFVVEAQEVLLWVLLSQSCFRSFKDSKKLKVLKHLLQLNCPLQGFVRFPKAAGRENGQLRKFQAIIENPSSASFSQKGNLSPYMSLWEAVWGRSSSWSWVLKFHQEQKSSPASPPPNEPKSEVMVLPDVGDKHFESPHSLPDLFYLWQ